MQYKNILITGVTAGFGLSMLESLSKEGYHVIGCGRRKDRLDELQQQYKNVTNFEVDVSDHASVEKFAQELKKQNIEPDVIINNAGLALGMNPADQCTLSDWETMIDTNIKGTLYITHAFLNGMRERNFGYVMNIGSIAGATPYPGGNTYSSTKAFVAQFTKNLKCDLLGSNVKVTCIEPGIAETEFSIVRFSGDQSRAKKVYEGLDSLKGEDIADIVKWLLKTPPHVNVNAMQIMPVGQAWGPFVYNRQQ